MNRTIINIESNEQKRLNDREILKKLDSTYSEMPREEVLDFLVIEGKKLGLCIMDKTNPDSSYTNYLRDILYFIYQVGANQKTYVTLSDETRFLKDEDSRTNFFAAVADKLKQNDKLESMSFGFDWTTNPGCYDLLINSIKSNNTIKFITFPKEPSGRFIAEMLLKENTIKLATSQFDPKFLERVYTLSEILKVKKNCFDDTNFETWKINNECNVDYDYKLVKIENQLNYLKKLEDDFSNQIAANDIDNQLKYDTKDSGADDNNSDGDIQKKVEHLAGDGLTE
ncbi:MAG: hypothetical protein K9G11_03290 [Rickettsiaceae bacterium]|nr:hypothetical protein [Rickettsiaceae bacterium]